MLILHEDHEFRKIASFRPGFVNLYDQRKDQHGYWQSTTSMTFTPDEILTISKASVESETVQLRLADAAEALGRVAEDGTPVTVTWAQVVEAIWELREERDSIASDLAELDSRLSSTESALEREREPREEVQNPEHMRYLGVLGLLGECSVYVPEEVRESIIDAMEDAVREMPGFRARRLLNRVTFEAISSPPPAESPEARPSQRNCRSCAFSYMEPDSGLICGHSDLGLFGKTIAKEPLDHCGWKKFQPHQLRNG